MHFTALRNRLARDQERMTCGADALSSSFKHLVGNVVRIGPANCLSASVDSFGEFDCLGYRLSEYRLQKLNSSGVSSSL
jgi:hypothetical protein